MTWPSTRQGMISTLLTILPGQEGGGVGVGLAEDDDPERRRVGRAGPGHGDQGEQQAREAEAAASRPVLPDSVFGCGLARSHLATPAPAPGLRPRFCLRRTGKCPPAARLARSRPRAGSVGLPPRWTTRPTAQSDFIAAGLASLGIEADEIELAVIGAAHQLFWPGDPASCSTSTPASVEPEREPDLSKAPGGRHERARPLAARAGGGDRRRRGRPGRAARRGAGADRGAQPGAQRRRRDLPRALARDARRRPPTARCTASRS